MSQIQSLIEKARRYLRSVELLIQDGDYDSDGDSDLADFCILAEHWLAADNSSW